MSRQQRRLTLGTAGIKMTAPRDGNMGTYDLRHDRRAQTDEVVEQVAVDQIDPSPWQHRVVFDDAELRSMAHSFGPDGSGLLQPPTVRRKADGRYELIAGERRVRAAQLVPLTHIRVLVRELDDIEARIAGAMENVERKSLTPLEASYAMLDAVTAQQQRGGRANAGAGSIASEWAKCRAVINQHLAVARAITPSMLIAAGGASPDGALDPVVVRGLKMAALTRAASAGGAEARLGQLRDEVTRVRQRAASAGRRRTSTGRRPESGDTGEAGRENAGDSAGAGPASRDGFYKRIRKPVESMTPAEARQHLRDFVPVVTALAARALEGDECWRLLTNAVAPMALFAVPTALALRVEQIVRDTVAGSE